MSHLHHPSNIQPWNRHPINIPPSSMESMRSSVEQQISRIGPLERSMSRVASVVHVTHVDLSNWDDKATVIRNYKSFGVVSNPNLLGVRSRTSQIIETESLQVPPPPSDELADEFAPLDSGSDLEEDDLKSAMGKKRRDGKHASPQPLTAMQRVYVSRMVDKYGDKYQGMFMDTKLNAMQHSVATLEKLCKRYHAYKYKNPLIASS